jgi:hypothetical protein
MVVGGSTASVSDFRRLYNLTFDTRWQRVESGPYPRRRAGAIVPLASSNLDPMLRYWTAGESHGQSLLALVDGFPAGLRIEQSILDEELRRRQGGYGRGGRQRIETDTAEILSGVWKNETIGSPIALQIVNRDAKLERLDDVTRPRPGHGDLSGAIKYLGSVRGVWNGPVPARQPPVWQPGLWRDSCCPSSR